MSRPRDGEPSLFDYVKAAFLARSNVRGLGGIPANLLFLLAVATAGAVTPGAWLIGAGIEIAYLLWLSHHPRFRNIVRGDRLRERALTYAQRLHSVVDRLPIEARRQWEELRQKCDAVRELGAALQPQGGPRADAVQEAGLNSLLMIHASLLQSRATLDQYVSEGVGREIEAKLEESEQRLASAQGEAIRRSLEANVAILKKRLEHHRSARQNIEVIESELERIENQVDLIREEASIARDPEALSARIDSIAATIGDVNQVLAVSAELLGDFDPAPVAVPIRTGVQDGN